MQDLSAFMPFGIMGESSMAAGNTSSVNPDFSPPGSLTEAYALAPVSDHPELDLGDVWQPVNRVQADDASAGYGWTSLDADDGSATDAGFTET